MQAGLKHRENGRTAEYAHNEVHIVARVIPQMIVAAAAIDTDSRLDTKAATLATAELGARRGPRGPGASAVLSPSVYSWNARVGHAGMVICGIHVGL